MFRLSPLTSASLLIVALFATILPLILLQSSPAAPVVPRRWEYRLLLRPDVEKLAAKLTGDPLLDGLTELGKEGWELAAVEPSFRPTNSTGPREPQSVSLYIFKRLK